MGCGTPGPGDRCEIAIVNSGFGGTRLGRGVGGAIPRERVRKFAAGRRSVRRRRRARAPGVRWAYFLRLNIRVLIFLLSGLVLSRLFRTNLTVTVGHRVITAIAARLPHAQRVRPNLAAKEA